MSVLSSGQFFGTTSARRETAGIAVSRLDHRSGRKLPMHIHEQAYFSMVLEGGYREETGRRVIDYDPFTIVYHPPGTAHLDEIGPDGARFLIIEADAQLVADHELGARLRGGFPTPLAPGARWTALQLLRDDADTLLRESITLDLLAAVDEKGGASGAPAWLLAVLEQVRDEFRSPPATAQLARYAGVHPVHLARVVRRETGTTLAGIVRQRRVEHAMTLLPSEEPLASIAMQCGFSDQAHFTRSVREITGFTPAELRRLL